MLAVRRVRSVRTPAYAARPAPSPNQPARPSAVSSAADSSRHILDHLDAVTAERARRAADATLATRTRAVREFQAERLRTTYADLLAAPGTRRAAIFFLDELYGVQDFLERDAQFRRIVPAIVRLFPGRVVVTVTELSQLHALTERLDTRMATAVATDGVITPEIYAHAWRQVGEPQARRLQIDLVERVGRALADYTRHPSLGRALQLMRLPARAAGLASLQAFLERGFAIFGALAEPHRFLDTITTRERALADRLFQVE